MSDPVSNAEIEDVLSSIRRLVSEEPPGASERAQPDPDQPVERFVLTPAFRVEEGGLSDADEASRPAQSEQPAAPAPRLVEDITARPVAEVDVLAPGEAAETSIPAEFDGAQEWSDIAPQSEPDPVPQPTPIETRPLDVDHGQDALRADHTGGDLTLEDRIAELEAAIERAPQEWEPDGSEDGSDDETRPLSFDTEAGSESLSDALRVAPLVDEAQLASQDDVEQALETALAGEGGEAAHWQPADAESTATGEEPDSATAEAAELLGVDPEADAQVEELQAQAEPQAQAETEMPVEEDEPLVDLHANEEFVHQTAEECVLATDDDVIEGLAELVEDDGAELEPEASSEVEAEPETLNLGTDDQLDNILADDEQILDEEALREMVSDLVRQELQGVLGERITRNVRRLVRREIQRALALRDLE